MSPKRRAGDTGWVKAIGWVACLTLAGSLTYTFISVLSGKDEGIDAFFFALQATASLLFLIYSVKIRSPVFVAANGVAVLNAVGTLLTVLVRR